MEITYVIFLQNGRTALHYAALNGHLEVCKLLAQKGCRLDDQDVVGFQTND